MAIVVNPLLSGEASGQVGKSLVFGKNKGRNVVRGYTIPSNPRTALQQPARAAIGAAGRMVKLMESASPAQLAFNTIAPAGLSGANTFVREMCQRYGASETAYNAGGNATVKGYFDAAALSAGIINVTIPGDTPVEVPAGLVLWNGYEAAHYLDATIADTVATSATEAEITEFLGTLQAA